MTPSARPAGAEFPRDHFAARERFLAAAAAAGAHLEHLALPDRGPRGEPLGIDIAWLGAQQPRAVLLHCAGLHGVEAYAGSAVQCRALAQGLAATGDSACALVHVLNPWGMAWGRRTNARNVDLNRNFLDPDRPYRGAPAGYRLLDPLLNPPSPPRRDGFTLRALAAVLRHGRAACTAAVAGGQYDYPCGLFFGGREPQPEARAYAAWLAQRCAGAAYLLTIDLHTGLGRRGQELLIHTGSDAPRRDALERALGGPRLRRAGGDHSSYAVTGGHDGLCTRLLPQAAQDFVTEEFGTCGPLRVLGALRDENRAYHYAAARLPAARQRLRERLCPSDARWRSRVLDLGVERLHKAMNWVRRQAAA